MKLIGTFLALVISLTSLFSQEYIKNAKVSFKDKYVVKGDFYYYPTLPNVVQVEDSTGIRKDYLVSDIDFVEGKNCLVKNIRFVGSDKLFECVVEGEKLSLYKTNENEYLKLYVLKDNQLSWLECGKKEVKIDSKRYNQEILTYRGILKVLMNDNPGLSNKVDKISCSEKEIADLVIAYNDGHITYLKSREAEKKDRTPAWKIYSGYSRFSEGKSKNGNKIKGDFGQLGIEFFPFEGSRHSFRYGFEYGKYDNKQIESSLNNPFIDLYNYSFVQSFNVNVSYYYDFLRLPKYNLYFGARLADVGRYWGTEGHKYIFIPRLSPCMGMELHLTKRLDVYGEISHLLKMNNLLQNYSIGLSYDI